MNQIELAESIARKAHEGQFRRDGVTPYIVHPERVVARLKTQGEDAATIATAWLHDVIEDTETTEIDLFDQGVNGYIVEAVDMLTRDESETYGEFLSWIKQAGGVAQRVKIADILDNLSDAPTEKQIIKYSKALLFLLSQPNQP